MAQKEFTDDLCTHFSNQRWHDSKILDLHLVRHSEKRQYDVRLDLDLYAQGTSQRSRKTAIFRECRIIFLDLDLLGVVICGGDIGSATCYKDATELETDKRNKLREFDFPQDHNSLGECTGFFFEMIPSGRRNNDLRQRL